MDHSPANPREPAWRDIVACAGSRRLVCYSPQLWLSLTDCLQFRIEAASALLDYLIDGDKGAHSVGLPVQFDFERRKKIVVQ